MTTADTIAKMGDIAIGIQEQKISKLKQQLAQEQRELAEMESIRERAPEVGKLLDMPPNIDGITITPTLAQRLSDRNLSHQQRCVIIAGSNRGLVTAQSIVRILTELELSRATHRNLSSLVHKVLNEPAGSFEPYGPRGQYRLREHVPSELRLQ